MLDSDLAGLYEVETKMLKRAVRRNIERFPDDFMFELTKEELENWRYQFGTSNKEKMGLRVEAGSTLCIYRARSNYALKCTKKFEGDSG